MASLFTHYNLIKSSGLFDEAYYAQANPEVRERNLDPLVHYLETGARELRNPSKTFDAREYFRICKERGEQVENPLLHYLQNNGKVAKTEDNEVLPESVLARGELLLSVDRITVHIVDRLRRLSGFGWCLSDSAITELRLQVGTHQSPVRYGIQRADVARKYPKTPKSDLSGFEFDVALGDPEQNGTVELLFLAKTASGASRTKALPVDLDAIPSVVNSAAEEVGGNQQFKRPPMQVQIDAASVDATGILQILGWAVCLVPIASIQVFVDDERLAPAETGRMREDVAAIHPDYPNAATSGFLLLADVSLLRAGVRTIKVRATATTGISREVVITLKFPGQKRALPVRASAVSAVECFCDLLEVTTAGGVRLKGWAVGATPTESISVLLDDAEIGQAEIFLERPDVGNRFPALSHARQAGFALRYQGPHIAPGEHLVVVRHRSGGDETDVLLPVAAIDAPPADQHGAPSAIAAGADVLLNIDKPQIADALAVVSTRGDLEIVGWALASKGVASVDIAVDGRTIKSVETCVHRRDVQRAYPDREGAATSGFLAIVPGRSLGSGRHKVSVTAQARDGQSALREFYIEVDEISETEGPWALRRRITPAEIAFRRGPSDHSPKVSFGILLPMTSTPGALEAVRVTVRSLAEQVHADWAVWVVIHIGATEPIRARLLHGLDELTERLNVVSGYDATGWSERFERSATHILFLRAGDELGCDALLEYAAQAALNPNADLLYADERRVNVATGRIEAFFKPQWSPDLLLSMNYLGRAWCARIDVCRRAGITVAKLADRGDYDAILRLTECAARVVHVPVTLHQTPKLEDNEATQRTALKRALERRNIKATVVKGRAEGTFRIKRKLASRGLVSIIIPTCAARGLVKACLESIRSVTSYRRFEIVCIENIPVDKPEWKEFVRAHADTVVETSEPFNWSRFNNLAVAASRGEFLLFLNDDIEVVDASWLEALLEQAQRDDIGAVGPLLLYPDRRVQHAGMFWAQLGIARHAFRYAEDGQPGYFGLAMTQREVIAVTGACLMTRRETFEALGRFDESHSIILNDVDYCLRLRQSGLRTVYTPNTTLIHHELASRGDMGEEYDTSTFKGKWESAFLAGDPYFHPRLTREHDDYAVEWEPTVVSCAGNPVFEHSAIRRILIVKLDHIGDCVIALPAVRRIKQHFPQAGLVVLSASSSKSVWELEPMVDEILEFNFFHARSSMGEIGTTEEHLNELKHRLAPCRFDLAIDLRKHWETRHVLQHTGARYLAGFDTKGKFPWLDVALEWAEDSALIRKRQHTADDLINLVDTVAASADSGRAVIRASAQRMADEKAMARLPIPARTFEKRVVCIHPGAGNETKQWPEEYFVSLIDQLVELETVNVVLVGGADEAELGKRIGKSCLYSESVWSLVGQINLNDLPTLLSRCSLFVGNDSGPKHIAAGLGIPTVGIHSGVVDAREWGPKGINAIAIYREMTCAPCYHTKVENCGRGLACLRGLPAEQVITACRRLLAASAPSASHGHQFGPALRA
jgi:O-antigen biosynthesis protein